MSLSKEDVLIGATIEVHLRCSADEFQKYRLTGGDILFNRTNSFEHVGRTGIFDLTRTTIVSHPTDSAYNR